MGAVRCDCSDPLIVHRQGHQLPPHKHHLAFYCGSSSMASRGRLGQGTGDVREEGQHDVDSAGLAHLVQAVERRELELCTSLFSQQSEEERDEMPECTST